MLLDELILSKGQAGNGASVIEAGRKVFDARLMRQQVVQGNPIASVFAIIRQIIRDLVVQVDLAFLDQLHHEHAAELFADRSQPKLGVRGIGNGKIAR